MSRTRFLALLLLLVMGAGCHDRQYRRAESARDVEYCEPDACRR